ncbi:hypothetical protein [Actinomadura sp. 6N118]|uniref:hypothetical protein n=1 Tax=Actinomadura sp. 6N118 TaxID=3375151 RepID=UPI00379F3D51
MAEIDTPRGVQQRYTLSLPHRKVVIRQVGWTGRIRRVVAPTQVFSVGNAQLFSMHFWQVAFVAGSVAAVLPTGIYRDGAGPLTLHLAASAWLSGMTALMVLDALRAEPVESRVLYMLAWSMAPVIVTVQLVAFGTDPRQWDLLWAPASVLTVAGWSRAKGLSKRLRRTLRRLSDRDVLTGGPGAVEELSGELDRLACRWAWGSGIGALVAFMVTGPWIGWMSSETDGPTIWLGPFGTAYLIPILLGVALAGAWLGRVASYGRIGSAVRKHEMRIRVVAGHQDGAGGLQPIGAYLLHQSLLAAIPAIYMGAWLFFFAFTDGKGIASRYQSFETQFQWLLPFAIAVEVLAFLAPMWSLHTVMREEKEATLWAESDRLSRRIEQARRELGEDGVLAREDAERQLNALVQRMDALERAPIWPIDASIRRRFTLRNLGLLLPLVSYLLKNQSFWEKLIK